MNILTSLKTPFQPKLKERAPEQEKLTTGLENVAVNTIGDTVDPATTFVVFKNQAVTGETEEGVEVLRVSTLDSDGEGPSLKQGWIPKEAFREVGDAYYLPTYRTSPSGAILGGATRGLVAGGVPGAVAGLAGGLVGSKLGDSPSARMASGGAAGALALTGMQLAIHGVQGLPSALFAGAIAGVTGAAAGSGDAQVRDSMLGGTAVGLAATMATGLPLGVLTGSAATAVGAQLESRTAQILVSAGAGAAITSVQALLSGNSVPLAAGIGAAIGGLGSAVGPSLGQLGRNLQHSVEPVVARGVSKALEGRGETAFQLASAAPQAMAFGGLGASLGLVAPGLAPLGIAVGATLGGAHGFHQAGRRIAELKALQQKSSITTEAAGTPQIHQEQQKS